MFRCLGGVNFGMFYKKELYDREINDSGDVVTMNCGEKILIEVLF